MKQYEIDDLIKHIQCENCKFKLQTLRLIHDSILHSKGKTAKDIAEIMNCSVQNTHRLLNILVKSELIKKVNDGDPTGGKLYRYTVCS